MLLSLFNLLKGRFSKDAISEAKANDKAMTRQEALQQMRNIASRNSGKKS
ncbi:hypothetical protein [Dyadobacter sp. CY323]|nr:hypothetical protein [Dyadobacter sp. CY323]MCE6989496.1 hypothetical protein [Dyadobacter sp. CY323]